MASSPKDQLEGLQKALGVDLSGDAEITLKTGTKVRELRIRSLGSAAYDIWSADFLTKVEPKENLAAVAKAVGVEPSELAGDADLNVSVKGETNSLRIRSLGSSFYDIWTAAELVAKKST